MEKRNKQSAMVPYYTTWDRNTIWIWKPYFFWYTRQPQNVAKSNNLSCHIQS